MGDRGAPGVRPGRLRHRLVGPEFRVALHDVLGFDQLRQDRQDSSKNTVSMLIVATTSTWGQPECGTGRPPAA